MPTMKLKRKGTAGRTPVKRVSKLRKVPAVGPRESPVTLPPVLSAPETARPPPKPIVVTGLSGQKIAIGIHPDGSSIIGRQGRAGPVEDVPGKGPMIFTGRSGRKIALTIRPDGTPVIGRSRFPSEVEAEKLAKAPTTQVKLVLEGPIGPEVPDQDPFRGTVKPEDVNPNVKHLDPRLFRPMSLRIVTEGPETARTTPPAKATGKPLSAHTLETIRRARRNP